MDNHAHHPRRWAALAVAGALALMAGNAWAIDPPLASAGLGSIEFSVGTSGPANGINPGGPGVIDEVFAEGTGAFTAAEDDIYLQSYSPGGFPFMNVKVLDDGGPILGTPGLLSPPGSLHMTSSSTLATDELDIDSYAIWDPTGMVVAAPGSIEGMYVQFSVDIPSVGAGPGPAPPDVSTEAAMATPEAHGDVFESGGAIVSFAGPPGPGFNTLIADEGAHGLTPAIPGPTFVDDLDALFVNVPGGGGAALSFPPPVPAPGIDTDGVGGGDTPCVFFTFNPAAPGGVPTMVGLASLGAPGAVICAPGPFFFGDVEPVANIADLGLQAGDNIDALYIDSGGMNIIISLDKFSPSLDPTTPLPVFNPLFPGAGADATDLIFIGLTAPLVPPSAGGPGPGGFGAPLIPPTTCVLAAQLGLTGDGPNVGADIGHPDNLNALWITATPTAGPLVPVELSVFTAD